MLEVFQDLLCPWCYIGKRKLERTLAALPAGSRPGLVWRAYPLIPDAPPVPGRAVPEAMAEYLAADQVPVRIALIEAAAAAEGLHLDVAGTRQVSSFDAHRLVIFAAGHGLAPALLELLFHAHFVEHRVISSAEVLSDLAVTAGLPRAEAQAVLAGSAGAAQVHADHERAARLGITAVPSYVLDGVLIAAGRSVGTELTRALAAAANARA